MENRADDLEIHFVYAGGYYFLSDLKSLIRKGMKLHRVNSVMVTSINIWRQKLITKENMENYFNGKDGEANSVNDDLESFFQDLRLGRRPNDDVITHYITKLTEEEMKLVEMRDQNYFDTIYRYLLKDDLEKTISTFEAEMKMSESKSQFVDGYCSRETFTIKNS